MDDLLISDLDRISSESFIKLKKLLINNEPKPTPIPRITRSTRTTRSKQISETSESVIPQPELARKILNWILEILLLKNKTTNKSRSQLNIKSIYEISILTLRILYNEKLPPLDIEKLHLTFILRLVDHGLVEESLVELWKLYCKFPHTVKKDELNPDYDEILFINIGNDVDSSMVGIVTSFQLLFLKVVEQCTLKKFKPLSNMSIVKALAVDEEYGIVKWCGYYSESVRNSKLTLVGKLVISISNSSSLITATQLRCAVLKILPKIDKGFVEILWKGVEKGCSQRSNDLISDYFIKASPSIIDFCLYRKVDIVNNKKSFSLIIDKLLLISKSVSPGNNAAHVKRSKQGLLTLKHLLDNSSLVKGKEEVGHPSIMGQLIVNPTNDSLEKLANSVQNSGSKALNSVESKKLLALVEKLLTLNDVEQLAGLVSEKFSIESDSYEKAAGQTLSLFSSWLKNQLSDDNINLPFRSIRALYLHLTNYFRKFNREIELKYISDSLLNLSSKCKVNEKASVNHIDLLYDSLSVELIILEGNSSSPGKLLIPKLERIVIGYLADECYSQAIGIIVKTLQVLFSKSDITRSTPIAEVLHNEFIKQCIVFATRIVVKKSSMVEILETSAIKDHYLIILEAILWNLIGNTKYDIQLPNSIMEILFSQSNLTYQYRSSIAYFLITGQLYPQLNVDCLDNFPTSQTNPESYYIKSMIQFSLAITDNNQQKVSYIGDSITGMVDFIIITKSPQLYSHEMNTLSSFLELHTFHKIRIHLLLAYVNSLEKMKSDITLQITYRLCIARSYHYLGYTGAVGHQLSLINKLVTPASSLQYAFFLTIEVEYFTSLDRKEDAVKSLSKLQNHINNCQELKEPLSAGRNSGETNQHFQERIILYCRLTHAFVELWVLTDAKELAIVAMLNITRLLPNLIKRPGYDIWCLSSLLMDSHFKISKIYEQVSIVKESQYYIQEAIKLAESTNCFLRLSQFLTFEAELFVRMGKSEQAQGLLHRCEEIFDDDKQIVPSVKGIEFLNIIYSTAFYLQRQNLFNEEKVYYDMGESIYSQVESTDITKRLSLLSLNDKKSNIGLESIRNKLIRSYVYSLGEQGLIDDANNVLELNTFKNTSREDVLFKLSESRNHYLKAKQLLMLDPVYGVLQDSAISVPSINNDDGRKSSLTNLPTNTQCAEAVKSLIQAKSAITENIPTIYQVCSNNEKVETFNLLNNITILLSAVCNAQEKSLYNYFSFLEQTKASSTVSERKISILKEQNAAKYLQWPKYENNLKQESDNLSLRNLPDNWLAVSLNIASTGNLILCKYEKERDPFMITLPLNRHTSRDIDETSFSFNDGLEKLYDIINRSNASADISRTSSITTPEEKRIWWNERFELDRELEGLLNDAEYCWLGGFRGIFDLQIPPKKLADKFANDFKTILNRYLPSRGTIMRSKSGKGKSIKHQKPITINPRVFELFLGLGHPDNLEDPGLLEDLVYFVLDIIQFHGEQNAYDELDIDQLVVDVEECLRGYHVRAENFDIKRYDHIILVVDKKCQQFPWESIPLLRKRSVTRVPSLSILNKLLLVKNDPEFADPGENVYYVLNPSKDLVRTQERFEQSFNNMSSWEGLICEPPSEDQFVNALSNNDLFIYIGHGGGEKYIRSAKIKSLKKCCPTLLFGCSSGVVQEAGEYDPFGTSMNFMVAGCPMLLANMWDVTDKDIDTFTKNMLENWGVLGGKDKVNIAEAVSVCRDDCTLKYLTGAAPVVYGLPLESAIVI